MFVEVKRKHIKEGMRFHGVGPANPFYFELDIPQMYLR